MPMGDRSICCEHSGIEPLEPRRLLAATFDSVSGILTVILIVAWGRDENPALPVAAVITAWLAVALYGSPWAFAWVLPVLALRDFKPALSTHLSFKPVLARGRPRRAAASLSREDP